MPSFPTLPAGAVLTFWDALPRDWKTVTEAYEYEDGGQDFNEVADNAPRRWRYEVAIPQATHAAAKAIADTYDTFFDTYRFSQTFNFTDKYGVTWDNVRIENYERTHDAHKSWVIFVKFGLVGYNSAATTPPDILPPDAIDDLSATADGSTVTLDWTPTPDN